MTYEQYQASQALNANFLAASHAAQRARFIEKHHNPEEPLFSEKGVGGNWTSDAFPQAAISKPTRTQPLEYDKPGIGAFISEHWLWMTPAALGLIGLAWYLVR